MLIDCELVKLCFANVAIDSVKHYLDRTLRKVYAARKRNGEMDSTNNLFFR